MLAALALSLALGGPVVAAPAPDIPTRSGGVRVVAMATAEVLEPITNDPRASDRPRRLSRTRDGRLLVEFE